MRTILAVFAIFFLIPASFADDLDDLDMMYARQPLENLINGGQPSLSDLKVFAERGVKMVINLRTPGEFDDFDEKAEVEALGMTYINIPVYGMKDLTAENAALLHEALESADGEVVLHCTIGMRAGSLLAVEGYLYRDLSMEEAKALGQSAHMGHIDEDIERALRRLEK